MKTSYATREVARSFLHPWYCCAPSPSLPPPRPVIDAFCLEGLGIKPLTQMAGCIQRTANSCQQCGPFMTRLCARAVNAGHWTMHGRTGLAAWQLATILLGLMAGAAVEAQR